MSVLESPSAPTADTADAHDFDSLRAFYERDRETVLADPDLERAHAELLAALEAGHLRAARPCEGTWRAVSWVKAAILIGFRAFPTVEVEGWNGPSFDRAAYLPRQLEARDGVRLVPGGSTVRRGSCLEAGVVMMPPTYVNVGAFVGAGTLLDSHVLVGSCAQIGKDVHLSAGVQIGGVLEPPGSCPVVIEEGAFVGAQSGIFEGVVVGAGAVLAPGVQLTASTVIYDLEQERTWTGLVPPGAVVVPGSRPASGAWAKKQGLSLYAPIIVKTRDASTDVSTALEEALR